VAIIFKPVILCGFIWFFSLQVFTHINVHYSVAQESAPLVNFLNEWGQASDHIQLFVVAVFK
jgi:hypothetical protein